MAQSISLNEDSVELLGFFFFLEASDCSTSWPCNFICTFYSNEHFGFRSVSFRCV